MARITKADLEKRVEELEKQVKELERQLKHREKEIQEIQETRKHAGRPPMFSDKDKKRIFQAYESRIYTIRKLAELNHCSAACVHKIIHEQRKH